MTDPWHEISRFGKRTISSGLTSSRFGNISLLRSDRIFITCTGTMLDEIGPDQVVEVDLHGPSKKDEIASSEIGVHRSIYKNTSAKAVIHTHSPFAVAMSILKKDMIDPIDSEGLIFLGSVPIVEGKCGSIDLANSVSIALKFHNAAVARGHGVFVAGKDLAIAFTYASMVEHSAHVKYLVEAFLGKSELMQTSPNR